MSTFALLGDFLFTVLTSPEAFRATSEYTFAEHKVVEAEPRLQWLANELQKISLELGFHVAFVNPKTEMDRLRTAAEDHQARALIFGNGIHRGYFVIESIEETLQHLADDGSYIAVAAKLELREWIPGADFDPLAPPRPTTPPPGIIQATPAAGSRTPSAPTSAPFNPAQPISPHNLLPTAAIVQLSAAGAGPGVTYSPATYSQPGVSGVVGSGPVTPPPGNPANVSTATITRAG